MSQHEHERKMLDDLLSKTIEAEKCLLGPSKAVHLESIIGLIWHNAHIEKKKLDRRSGAEKQSQVHLQYRGCITFVSGEAANLRRALPDEPALQERLREIRETIKDAIFAIRNPEYPRR